MNCGQITTLPNHQRAQRLAIAIIFIGQFLQLIHPIERFARAHAVGVECGQCIAQGITLGSSRQSRIRERLKKRQGIDCGAAFRNIIFLQLR